MGNTASLAEYLEESANDTTSSGGGGAWYEPSLMTDGSSASVRSLPAAPMGTAVGEDSDSNHLTESSGDEHYFDAEQGEDVINEDLRAALSRRGLARGPPTARGGGGTKHINRASPPPPSPYQPSPPTTPSRQKESSRRHSRAKSSKASSTASATTTSSPTGQQQIPRNAPSLSPGKKGKHKKRHQQPQYHSNVASNNTNKNATDDLLLPPSKAIAKAMMLESVRARVEAANAASASASATGSTAKVHNPIHNHTVYHVAAAAAPPSNTTLPDSTYRSTPMSMSSKTKHQHQPPSQPKSKGLSTTAVPQPRNHAVATNKLSLTGLDPTTETHPTEATHGDHPRPHNVDKEQKHHHRRRRTHEDGKHTVSPKKQQSKATVSRKPPPPPTMEDVAPPVHRKQRSHNGEVIPQTSQKEPVRVRAPPVVVSPPKDEPPPESPPPIHRRRQPLPSTPPTSILKKQRSFEDAAPVAQQQQPQHQQAAIQGKSSNQSLRFSRPSDDSYQSQGNPAQRHDRRAFVPSPANNKKASQGSSDAPNDDSMSSQGHSGINNDMESGSRSTSSSSRRRRASPVMLRYACICLSLLFLVLLGIFLYFMIWHDDNNDGNNDKGVIVEMPTISPGTDAPPPGPTPGVDPTGSQPTLDVVLWEEVGSAIPLTGTLLDAPAMALSFDGRILALRHEGTIQTYQWESEMWVSYGSPIAVSESPTGTLDMAMNTAGNVLAWADPAQQSVHVLQFGLNDWQEEGVISIAMNGDASRGGVTTPYSLALSASGTVLAVGDPSSLNSAGRVHIFEQSVDNNSWVRTRTWLGSLGSQTGWDVSLSLDGGTLAVGAVDNALSIIEPGMVRVYRKDNAGTWKQLGQTLVGLRDGDRFGASVMLSGSGQQLVIGAPAYDASEDSDGQTAAGVARVLQMNEDLGVWEPHGETLLGSTGSKGFGNVVSLSGNAELVAVTGATGEMRIHRINASDRWIYWGLSSLPVPPSSVLNTVLAGNGRVVAVIEGGTNNHLQVYRALSW